MSVNNNPNNPIKYTTTTKTTTNNAAHNTQTEQIRVTRELDGLNSTGIIGELLTNGTANLADANKYFAMSKFAVSGLLAEDNQAVSTAANISKKEGDPSCNVLCADDMYLAGDPGVGGKGNNYAFQEINIKPGYYTMYEDGKEGGPKITINGHADKINPEGKTALTEYGFIIQDKDGTKTKATLSGGVLTIIGADGSTRKLLPGEEYTVGNGTPPTAKFYYADVPGAGKDGATEKRLIVEYYEKPSPETIEHLVAQGVSRAEAEKLISKKAFSYGFRTPDGVDTYAMSEGVGAGAALKTLPNGVKTYYDSHYSTGSCTLLDITKCEPPPPPPPPPPPVAANEHARIWGDPHIEEADSGKYDFNEVGLFNVLKDKGIALNAKTVQGPGKTTIISEAGLTIGGRTVLVGTDGKVTIGYADSSITSPPVTLKDGQTVMLDNGYSITRKGAIVTVDSTGGEYKIQFDTDESYKGFKYIDIDVWSKAGGVLSDGVAPTGLLGETFDEDSIKQTKTKNSVNSYKVDSLVEKITNSTPPATEPEPVDQTPEPAPTPEPEPTPTTPTTPSPASPPAWTGDMSTYLPQLISWLMQLLGIRQ
ncbi:MAG TPA: DUF1521 domain-containing protein [Oculatellaceae cyanobacterium]